MKTFRFVASAMFALSAYVCLPVILIVLTADVTLRYGFNHPIRWGQELASILLFLSVVLALPHSWLSRVHISADFLKGFMSARTLEAVARLTWLLVFVMSCVIVWQCWRDAQFMLMIDESTPELFVPLAHLRGALALGAGVSGILALLLAFSRTPLITAEDAEEASL